MCESCSVMSNCLWSHGLYSPWNSLGQNTRVGSLSLLQGIFPTQGSNPGLLHCRWILYQLSHKGSPDILEWVAYPSSSRSSWLRNQTGVSCIAGGFFTNWTIYSGITKEDVISSTWGRKRSWPLIQALKDQYQIIKKQIWQRNSGLWTQYVQWQQGAKHHQHRRLTGDASKSVILKTSESHTKELRLLFWEDTIAMSQTAIWDSLFLEHFLSNSLPFSSFRIQLTDHGLWKVISYPFSKGGLLSLSPP